MVVQVEEIREEGLELKEPFTLQQLTETLGPDHELGYKPRAGSEVKATFHKVSGGVLLTAELKAEVTAPCKRCLTDVDLSVPVSFTLSLLPRVRAEGDSEDDEDGPRRSQIGSFDLEDANQEPFDGKTIDVDPIVREQVLLALPMYVVCDEDCQGLCPVCGQDLNEKQCGHERKTIDPRLVALKNIKLN